jgi:hypothetical protein
MAQSKNNGLDLQQLRLYCLRTFRTHSGAGKMLAELQPIEDVTACLRPPLRNPAVNIEYRQTLL